MMFPPLRVPGSRRARRSLFALLLLLGGAFASAAHAGQKTPAPPPDKDVTIVGLVEKAAVDENDNVIAVEIQEDRGGETEYYLVNDDAKGNELLGLVGARVEVIGVVDEDEDDNKILTVKSYSVK